MVNNRVMNDRPAERTCLLRNLEIGAIAVDCNGKHYMRTCTGATCLANGDTYTFGCGEWPDTLSERENTSTGPTFAVTPLPLGTRITIIAG